MFDFVKVGTPDAPEKDLWNLLNKARNFFKHEGDTLEERIEFNDTMNDFALLSACTDCATLTASYQPPEVLAYTLWHLGVEAPDAQAMEEASHEDPAQCRAIQDQIDGAYPGLRSASRPEQKRFGCHLLRDALAGTLVTRGELQASNTVLAPGLAIAGHQ
jgi:hypothetical protein